MEGRGKREKKGGGRDMSEKREGERDERGRE